MVNALYWTEEAVDSYVLPSIRNHQVFPVTWHQQVLLLHNASRGLLNLVTMEVLTTVSGDLCIHYIKKCCYLLH